MSWDAFIIPATVIVVQVLKRWIKDTRIYPLIAIVLGGLLGLAFGAFYAVDDIFLHVAQGAIYGATAAGVYDGATAAYDLATKDTDL